MIKRHQPRKYRGECQREKKRVTEQNRTPENFRQRLLPYNWKKESICRESGKLKGRWDNYLCTPNGERLRSDVEFVNFLRKNADVKCDREVTFVSKHL